MDTEKETLSAIMGYLQSMSQHMTDIARNIESNTTLMARNMETLSNDLDQLAKRLENSPYLAKMPLDASEIERLEAVKEIAGSTP
tara:strand:+ start:339 stop:593 length:255 start_codon:yes stop_codon:yes gene_type:complete